MYSLRRTDSTTKLIPTSYAQLAWEMKAEGVGHAEFAGEMESGVTQIERGDPPKYPELQVGPTHLLAVKAF